MSVCWTVFPLSSRWAQPNRHTQAVQIQFQQHATVLQSCSLSASHRVLLTGQVGANSTEGLNSRVTRLSPGSCRREFDAACQEADAVKGSAAVAKPDIKAAPGRQAGNPIGKASLIFKAHPCLQDWINTWVASDCPWCFSELFPSRFFCWTLSYFDLLIRGMLGWSPLFVNSIFCLFSQSLPYTTSVLFPQGDSCMCHNSCMQTHLWPIIQPWCYSTRLTWNPQACSVYAFLPLAAPFANFKCIHTCVVA